MFEQFLERYGSGEELKPFSNGDGGEPDAQLATSRLDGRAFANGAYRVHLPVDVGRLTSLAEETFPSLAQRITCFASDWLGRQFALDATRRRAGRAQVLLLEPGTGEVLEIPADIQDFHNRELVAEPDAALALSFYADWCRSGGAIPNYDQCIGYRHPLFLGGRDVAVNLALTDFEVYWNLSAQLLAATRALPNGTRSGKISVDG